MRFQETANIMCDIAGAAASRVSGLTSTLLTPAHRGPGRQKNDTPPSIINQAESHAT